MRPTIIEDLPADTAARLRSLADMVESGMYDFESTLKIDGDTFSYEFKGQRRVGITFSELAGLPSPFSQE